MLYTNCVTKNFLSHLLSSSEMVQRTREFDWSSTPVGPIESWSSSLKNTIGLILQSGIPMYLAWGDSFTQFYNDAYRPILGTGDLHPKALGTSVTETWPEIWSTIGPMWKRVKETGENFASDNFRLILERNGYQEESYFSYSYSPVRDDDGSIKGVLVTCLETTQQVLSGRDLKEALRARDEFISIASHELKTPLTSLKLQSQIQKRLIVKNDPKAYVPERITSFSEMIDVQINKLNRLVDDMLDISRINTGHLSINPDIVDLGKLILGVIDDMRSQFSANNFPKLDVEEKIFGTWDALRIEQVVANLLTNAIRYGLDRPILIKIAKESGLAVITVKDHGIGISETNHRIIFERFERLNEKEVSGLGLGLYLTKQIVEAHKGEIKVLSKLGEGSTFIVELPINQVFPPGNPRRASSSI